MNPSSATYIEVNTSTVHAADGTVFAFRHTGRADERPLLLLQHFRGNLDNWDPALIDALSKHRSVVTFDNTGVGASTGTTPSTVEQMAVDALAFVDALGLADIDVLGFSIGSFVAQELVLTRPSLIHRLVLASAAPHGGPGMHGWAPDVIGDVGNPTTTAEQYLRVFFTPSDDSQAAGHAALARMAGRHDGRDTATTWQTRMAQYDAVTRWGVANHALLQRATDIDRPTLIANGDSDRMILPRYSHLLAGLVPEWELILYPDAAHGFLFQHHQQFSVDVDRFLST